MNCRILHIADRAISSSQTTQLLKGAGFSLQKILLGQKPIPAQLLQADLILLEMSLKKGFRIAKRLRELSMTRATPLLHLYKPTSSDPLGVGTLQDFQDGADGYLRHPAEPIELLTQIRTLLKLRQREVSFQEKLQVFVKANLIGILCGDIQGNIQDANDELLRMIGYTRQDLEAGQIRWHCLTPAVEQSRDQHAIAEAKTKGTCTPYEKTLIHKNGTQVPVLAGFTLLGATQQDIVAFVLDLSDRKQVETELRQNSEWLNLALDAAKMGSWDWDLIQNQILWSPYHEEIFGYESGTPQRSYQDWLSRIHPEDLPQVQACMQDSLEKHSDYECEHRVLWPDGNVRWIVAQGRYHYEVERPVRMVGMIIDITQRKYVEQLLRQHAEELTLANQMKDEFLAILSHELRTPLNAILGWTQLLQQRQFAPDKLNHALEIIERNARLQSQLIEDLLDISRIVRGKIRLQFGAVDLMPVVQAAMDAVRSAAEAKSIHLVLNLLSGINTHTELWVLGDGDRLQQVIWNLLSNAIKFTPQGGKVEVRLTTLVAPTRVPEQHLDASHSNHLFTQIQVIDDGIGIAPEVLPYVFDRFYQVDSTLTRSYGGLGLGLAIARQLTELHGGTVQAYSLGEGQGSVFTIILPVRDLKHEVAAKALLPSTEGKFEGSSENDISELAVSPSSSHQMPA
jgi:PAS domain S-box-containing protein